MTTYRKYLLLVIIMLGCNGSKKPENLMTKQEMASLLIEVHLIEARLDIMRILPKDSLLYVYNKLEDELFEKKQVSRDTYLDSYEYYFERPKEMTQIYNIVVDSLMEKQNTRGSNEQLSEDD